MILSGDSAAVTPAAIFEGNSEVGELTVKEGGVASVSGAGTVLTVSTKLIVSGDETPGPVLWLRPGTRLAATAEEYRGTNSAIGSYQGCTKSGNVVFNKMAISTEKNVASGDTFLTADGSSAITKLDIQIGELKSFDVLPTGASITVLKATGNISGLTASNVTLKDGSSGNDITGKSFDVKVTTDSVVLTKKTAAPPAGGGATGSVTPGSSGSLSGTEVDGVSNVKSIEDQSALTAIGVTATVDASGKILLSGEPYRAGVFTIKVKYMDGTIKDITIEIKEVAVPATLTKPENAKTDWTVEYTGSKDTPSFVMYLPVTVELKGGKFYEAPGVELTGASLGSVTAVEAKGRGASDKWLKITGTVSDRATAALRTVKFHVGALVYTQDVNVKFVDTKFTDNATTSTPGDPNDPGNPNNPGDPNNPVNPGDPNYPIYHHSSGGGCDAGFGAIALLLAGAALLRRR